MAEYIEKEPLLRKAKGLQGSNFSSPIIVAAIEKAPTIEIVRCRDCKHFISDVCYHDLAMNLSRADDFCSYGERKEII